MILIHPDTWLEHWQERKNQLKKQKEKISDKLAKEDDPSSAKSVLVECDDLFICVDTQWCNCSA